MLKRRARTLVDLVRVGEALGGFARLELVPCAAR